MNLFEEKYRTGKVCPYCEGETKKVDSKVIYGKSYGDIMLCRPCNAYVGCHKEGENKGQAKGSVANYELREARKRAHYWFDKIAKTGLINKIWRVYIPKTSNRNKAYRWLSEQMGMDREHCHIGMMNVDQCAQVEQIARTAVEGLSAQTKLF